MAKPVLGRVLRVVMASMLVSFSASVCLAAEGHEFRHTDRDILSSWHGVWRGVLEDAPVPLDPSPQVQFTVGPGADVNDGCLVWRSEYFIDGVVVSEKDYTLCRDSDDMFRLEEGAGVFLNVSVFGDDLYSAFALTDAGIALFSHTHRDADVIVQDIYSTKGADEPSPGLSTFIGVKRQRVVLKRTGSP